MIALLDGMELFHGSYVEVSRIDLSRCADGKDFGRGFYVTSSYDQAARFVTLSLKRAQRSGLVGRETTEGRVSCYRLRLNEALATIIYQNADVDWLHLVAANRDKSLFPGILDAHEEFDVIGGKIANDRTAQTLQFYLAGAFGQPGDPTADEMAIRTLLPNRLKDQFCIRTERAIGCLDFVGSVAVGLGRSL